MRRLPASALCALVIASLLSHGLLAEESAPRPAKTAAASETLISDLEKIDAQTRRLTLASGVQATLLPKATRGETVVLALTLRFGSHETLSEHMFAANFLPWLMTCGTKQLSRQQLNDKANALGAGILGIGGDNAATFILTARRETLPQSLELFQQILREPALAADDLDGILRKHLAALEQDKGDPASMATVLIKQQLSSYDASDWRRVRTTDEKIQMTQSVTIEQIRALAEDYLGGCNGELTVVGDFDPDQVVETFEQMLSGWNPKQACRKLPAPPSREIPPSRHVIRTPDKANATLVAGLVLPITDADDDYPALRIVNYLLGDGAGSRLWDRVREREGLAYSVSSSLSADEYPSALMSFAASCNPRNIDRLEAAIQDELQRLLRDGITQEELDLARTSQAQSLRTAAANDNTIAQVLHAAAGEGRTLAYSVDLLAKIDALTLEQVNAAIRKHLDPKKLVIVTAGDFDK